MTTIVCEDTGRQAVKGECPHHRGDACLYDVSKMRDILNKNTTLKVALADAIKWIQDNNGRLLLKDEKETIDKWKDDLLS